MELIQYEPTTTTVRREPVLMQSAWMMKYYIMDLSPHNSLVKYLVERGHTVFMISWMNPGPQDRDLGMEDYRKLGTMAALDVIGKIVPGTKVHAVGYCLGGILLTIAAATMARDGDERLASITLFTTMTDFTEVGEINVFMDPSQVALLEDMMWEKGYLDPKQASGGFQLLKSKDLIWSKMVREYYLGQREPIFDLMAWNADGTRMPYRQHSELLRRLYLDNELFQGQVHGGRPAHRDQRHPRADLRRRRRRRPRRPLAFGLQAAPAERLDGADFRAHQRRPQRRHRQRAGPSAPQLPDDDLPGRRTLAWTPRPGRRRRPSRTARGGRPGSSGWRSTRPIASRRPPSAPPTRATRRCAMRLGLTCT